MNEYVCMIVILGRTLFAGVYEIFVCGLSVYVICFWSLDEP